MSLTYTGGSGLFDKLGVLIRVIDIIEAFETGTLATKQANILAEIETTNEYDDAARRVFYSLADSQTKTLRAWKQDLLALVQPIITQAMHDEETFFSQNLTDLLNYLKFCMIRDSKTVDQSETTLTGPAAGGSPTGNFSVVASKYASTVQGADASSQQNFCWSNTFRIVCINNANSGGETFRVEGDLPLNGRTHPSYMNAGNAGTLQAISSKSNTLLANGGFEEANSDNSSFQSWTLNTGTWATDVVRHATPYRGSYAIQFNASGKITQTLAVDTLKPWTKYLVTVKAKKANSADGTVNVGFTGTTGFYWTLSAASLTTSYAHYHTFFNTGADPGAIVDFIVELTSNTTGEVYIDEVTLTPVTIIRGTGIAVIAGSTDPALDDYWTLTVANGKEGTFMNFFGRWFDFLLPGVTGAAENIADSLAE